MNILPSSKERLDPYPFYSRMRHSHPVAYDDKYGIWGVFRYKDVVSILADHQNFSSDLQRWSNPHYRRVLTRPNLMISDPPRHKKLRNLISMAFTPRIINKLEPQIEKIANETIDEAIGKGCMDIVTDLAYPFPLIVIAHLLGVPPQDHNIFRRWATSLFDMTALGLSTKVAAERNHRFQNEMDNYFNKLISQRIQTPLGKSNADLITALLKAEVEGQRLSEGEILSFCSFLLLSGVLTMVNMIGNLVRSLLENIREFKRLQDDHSLILSTIEETLRYRSPAQSVTRFATRDMRIGCKTIRAGQTVYLWLASANRDESIFPNPDKFDITRDSSAHVAFGLGIHYCLGAALGKIESRILLKVMLERLHRVRRKDHKPLEPLDSILFHGLRYLPIRFNSGCRVYN